MGASRDQPTLWHIAISHYSEKARWALEYKSVEHNRQTAPPGLHIAVALWFSGGRAFTFPILELDGRRIADSTAIIAALEQRFPEPPLYPADPEERRQALELEEFFDEELGPYARRLAFMRHVETPNSWTRSRLASRRSSTHASDEPSFHTAAHTRPSATGLPARAPPRRQGRRSSPQSIALRPSWASTITWRVIGSASRISPQRRPIGTGPVLLARV